MLLDDCAFVRVELPWLVDDLRGDADLPDVVEERGELCIAPDRGAQPEPVADREHEIDDVTAVAPGVRVVGFDDVAEQKRGAAIGVTELDDMIDPRASLPREEPDQAEQWQGEQEGEWPVGERRVGDQEAEWSEREVDEVGEPDCGEVRPDVDAEGRGPGGRAAEIEGELCGERCREERPVDAPVGGRAAGGDQHQGRAERVPSVRDEDDRALQVPLAADVVRHAGEQKTRRNEQRSEARRHEKEHRHEDELRRDREPDPDLEPDT